MPFNRKIFNFDLESIPTSFFHSIRLNIQSSLRYVLTAVSSIIYHFSSPSAYLTPRGNTKHRTNLKLLQWRQRQQIKQNFEQVYWILSISLNVYSTWSNSENRVISPDNTCKAYSVAAAFVFIHSMSDSAEILKTFQNENLLWKFLFRLSIKKARKKKQKIRNKNGTRNTIGNVGHKFRLRYLHRICLFLGSSDSTESKSTAIQKTMPFEMIQADLFHFINLRFAICKWKLDVIGLDEFNRIKCYEK